MTTADAEGAPDRAVATCTADVVVVGLGAHGSATLYQLATRGARVVGIDRHDPPHDKGSSHGETRITRLAVGEGDAYGPIVRRSHEIWRALEQRAGVTLMTQTGGLIMAPSAAASSHHGQADFVERNFALAARFGTAHERLDAAEIGRRYPQFRLRGDELGYYEPGAGMLHPEACIATQLRLAEAHGATVRRHEVVLGLEQHDGAVRITTDRARIDAGHVVLTCGPWLAPLLPPDQRGLARVYRQVLHWFPPLDPAAYAVGRLPVFIWLHGEHDEDYFYGFPTLDAAGGVKVASEVYAGDTDPDRVVRHVTAEEAAAMHRRHVAPRLHGLAPQALRSSVCLYTVTPDFGFIVDAMPGQDRVTVVSACSGHGFKHSAALGEAVAQRVLGGASTLDLGCFGMSRFSPA